MRAQRRNFRSRLAAAITVLLGAPALAAGTGCSLLSGGPEPGLLPSNASPRPAASTSASLPPEVVASIHLQHFARPLSLAAVDGDVWVASQNAPDLFRIDPTTNRVVQTVDIRQASCGQLLEAFGDLLTMPCIDSTQSIVVDGRSGSIRGTIPDSGGMNAAAGADSLWIPNHRGTALKRINPRTLKIEKRIRVETGMVAFDGRFIWSGAADLSSQSNGHLAKIDPITNRVVARYRLSRMDGPYMTYGFGALWFKPFTNPTMYRFELASGTPTEKPVFGWEQLTAPDQPVAVGAGSLWIRRDNATIARINPSTQRISGLYPAESQSAGGIPLIAFGSLWIVNYYTDSVWREQIRPNE
ncbi:NHL repeat-containing protein [Microlunatus ginsengisoli]|uniref:Uncharacterized protein n=1 Tax=Microlunatus ginsengisoli TaxID=363863 RepID=A0ABP7AYX8_9ACTN